MQYGRELPKMVLTLPCNTPVHLAGAQEFNPCWKLVIIEQSAMWGRRIKKLLAYGNWEIEELSPHQ